MYLQRQSLKLQTTATCKKSFLLYLTLEQHQFKLSEFTYTQHLFSAVSLNTIGLHSLGWLNLQMWKFRWKETMDMKKSQIWRGDYKLHIDFLQQGGLIPKRVNCICSMLILFLKVNFQIIRTLLSIIKYISIFLHVTHLEDLSEIPNYVLY